MSTHTKAIATAALTGLTNQRDNAQKRLDGIQAVEDEKEQLTESLAMLEAAIEPIQKELDDIEAEEKMAAEQAEAEAKKAEAAKADATAPPAPGDKLATS